MHESHSGIRQVHAVGREPALARGLEQEARSAAHVQQGRARACGQEIEHQGIGLERAHAVQAERRVAPVVPGADFLRCGHQRFSRSCSTSRRSARVSSSDPATISPTKPNPNRIRPARTRSMIRLRIGRNPTPYT